MTDFKLEEWINRIHLSKEHLETYRSSFLSAKPFEHIYLDNFLLEDKLHEIIMVLSEQQFLIQEADLYQFAQTPDFDELDVDQLVELKSFFKSDQMLEYIERLTQIEVSSEVDMLGNIYRDTDYLLCHDDQLSSRKIAYILYLTDLETENGGSLNFFDTLDGKPNQVVRKIAPKYNRFALFRVTQKSFHEVGEILGPDVFRVSISGWFNSD